MKVAIIMGSTSDLSKVEPAVGILKEYGVEVNVRCLSAHRAHLGLSEFIEECNGNGTEVIITAAFRFCIRWNGCIDVNCADAIRNSGCNSSNQRKQECRIPCIADHRCATRGDQKQVVGRT